MNAFVTGIVTGVIAAILSLVIIFAINHHVEVKTVEKPVFAGVELPIITMDGKQHNIYEFGKVILDISYDK